MSEQNYKDIFEEAMNQIHAEFATNSMENDFILNFNFDYVEDNISEITVSVPSEFMWNRMVSKGNVNKLKLKIAELSGQSITINHIVKSKAPEKTSFFSNINDQKKINSENNLIQKNEKTSKEKHPQLIEEYTFDNFVPGDNSRYAYSVCEAAAKSPGSKNYNPILLYGPSGVGKTHLMVAIGNFIYSQNSKLKISYITTESLMNEFTASLRERTTDKFTKKYRKLDVLLLDDIQFLEKSEKLQDELFYTFDEIYNRKGQIVFTSDRPLKEINGIVERLKTRFGRGQNIDLKVPDYETRLAIIDKKLEFQGKNIPQDVKELIAQTFQSNVRELEGALSKMIGYAELMNKSLTLEIAREQLSDSINTFENGIINVETIQNIVCDYYNVSMTDLKSPKREKRIAFPRHIAIYLSRTMTEYSLDEIGKEFGGRDHTTIMNSLNKIENLLKTDSMLIDTIKVLKKQIKG